MGKRWRKYQVGKYRLGQLLGQAVVVWKDEEGHHRRRLGVVANEVAARALLDEWVRKVRLVRADSGATVGDIWARYERNRLDDGKQAPQFKHNWTALAPRFATLPVDAITDDVCRDYARERLAAGVSQGTIWTELTKLRSCINWAVKRRVISSAPYVWLPKKPPPKQRILTPAEAVALIDACVMPHIRLFVILALSTAARKGALLGLEWGRVDFERGSIDLREPEVIEPLQKRARKSRAVVPMGAVARAALLEAKAGALTPYVIEWGDERVDNVRTGFMAACRRAGLADVTPHTLRHTAASWMNAGGIEMERIASHLGHRDPSITRQVYAKPDLDLLRPAADVIDMRLKRRG